MTTEIDTPIQESHRKIDRLESVLADLPRPQDRTIHKFTPGLYSRTFVMPAGSIYTSKIHKTEHQFVVSKGMCSVKNVLTDEWIHISAPYLGVTQPGSRRVLVIHEDTVWTTFHPTNETDLEKLEAALIDPHEHTLQLAQRRASCLGLE